MRLLREPLLHFLLIGLILFGSYELLNPNNNSSAKREIIVGRVDLLDYMRYRNSAVANKDTGKILEQMSPSQRQALIDDYVREEALFREAKALGLDRQDPVARQRLIRQLEYITTSFIVTDDHISEDAIRTYFADHQKNYYRPAEVTFTHVFFGHESRGQEEARRQAERALQYLNTSGVHFHEGLEHGDRFLYYANYVNRQAEEVASHFGPVMQRQLFQLVADDQVWKGPFTSSYGEHLVLLTKKKSGYVPELHEIRDEVIKDIQRFRLDTKSEKAIQSVIESYKVTVAESLLPQGTDGRTDYSGTAE